MKQSISSFSTKKAENKSGHDDVQHYVFLNFTD